MTMERNLYPQQRVVRAWSSTPRMWVGHFKVHGRSTDRKGDWVGPTANCDSEDKNPNRNTCKPVGRDDTRIKPERTPRNFSELLIAINSFLQHPTLWLYYRVLLARKMNAATIPNFMKTSFHTENDTVLLLLSRMLHFTHYKHTPRITALQTHLSRV